MSVKSCVLTELQSVVCGPGGGELAHISPAVGHLALGRAPHYGLISGQCVCACALVIVRPQGEFAGLALAFPLCRFQ